MEKSCKVFSLCLGLLFCELCNGLPINLENTIADSHTQLLTGLVAVLLTVCSVVFLAGCLCCQRRNGFKEFRDSPVVASAASNLDHGHINPVANGEFTIFTPLSPPHQNNNVFLANLQVIIRTEEDYIYGDVDVSSWFDGTEKDFPRIKLKYIKEIGRGWFGRVVEGAAQDIEEQQKWSPVSVRILEATASSRERVNFLHDCAIYRCGEHPNILQLVGRCLDTIPLLILQEFCPEGDLKNYLRQNQVTADKLLNSEFPLQWCCQLTSALKHIHDRKLTHSDLAARNCQLTSNLTLKLGDYGLAVSHYPDDYYQGALGVPVRWCAPEVISYTNTTIEPKRITPEANIWSLGVTIWEICECGQQPYSDLTDDDVISQVLGSQNVRLNRPKVQVLYTDYIYRLMQLCWTNCESRPGVAQIDLMLADLLQVYKNTTTTNEPNTVLTEDFDERWESFKPNSIVKTDNHVSDNISTDVELEQSEIVATKPLSPSLNNLHGSLDNLVVAEGAGNDRQMESWLENVATNTGDMSFVQGLSDAIKDLDNALALENSTSSESSHQHSPQRSNNKNPKIEFKLGPLASSSQLLNETSPNQADSMTDSMIFIQRASSESETEEENWKTKIERGAYSEKVRQKSRSVADLMVLTHIDQSESDTETPLPSLDYKNYRNVRCGPKQNLENVSLMFGSEGNLLNVQDTFQEELKKLKVERRDSLLFVPESQHSQTSEKQLNKIEHESVSKSNSANVSNNNYLEGSPSKRLLQELNSPSEIQPVNQVYNVFNVTIDKFSPVHLNHQTKLSEFINLNDEQSKSSSELHEVPKLSDIIQSNSELVNYLTCHPLPFESNNKSINSSDGECENGEVLYDSGVEGDRMESTESLLRSNIQEEEQHCDKATNCQNGVTTPSDDLSNTLHSDLDEHITINIEKERSVNEIKPTILMQVPKLVDLIQNNDDLMDYIIAKYESEVNLDKSNENFDSLDSEHGSIDAIDKTKDFINEERTNYQDNFDGDKKLKFDLSETQDEAMPNSLTHSSVFSSTPFSKRSLPTTEIEPTQDGFSLNLFDDNVEEQTKNTNNPKLYSLETWDNFLGKSFDNQNDESQQNELFDSFTSEPHSLMYIESVKNDLDDEAESEENDRTYTKTETLIKPDHNIVDIDDINLEMEDNKDENWDSSGGWFLHPQSNSEDISGDINVVPGTSTDSYVGFNMDDEIMAAIRNELLNKLPQAQSGSNGTVTEDEEWETTERNEVFLRYNVYNTPLSPIPEESFLEEEEEETSCESTPRQQSDDENEDSDWSEHCEREVLGHDSPMHPEPLHRHTPSQDSCCSNDTLFNLEELTCATNDIDRESPIITTPKIILKDESSPLHQVSEKDVLNDGALSHSINNESTVQDDKHVESIEDTPENNTIKLDATITTTVVNLNDDCETINEISENVETSKEYIEKFLASERSCVPSIVEEPSSSGEGLLPFINKQVAPLPSPEDNPWKQLPASLLSYDKVISQNMLLPVVNETNNIVVPENDLSQNGDKVASVYVNILQERAHDYENVQSEECGCASYENIVHIDDDDYEADYVNIVNMENSKNAADFDSNHMDDGDDEHEDDDDDDDDDNENDIDKEYDVQNDFLVNNEDGDENDVFGVLTDIRFSGPSDNQLMTTSFSESNDLNDEQDWDSGSDTRSSSSGEFIWKEGEHEESLKALRAAPQDTLDDIKPMEEIQEETTSEESTSGSDEEGESPEFVPSAWDKFATPTKSAMRSPEKTLEKTDQEKKSKGVWFKKQKYHCVYEYPREPESPVLHSYDLWKPQQDYSSYADWDLDGGEPFVANDTNDDFDLNFYQPKPTNRNLNLYQLSSIPDFISSESAQSLNSGIVDDEFYISSSSKPFDMLNGLSSQFFPGNNSWLVEKQQQPENATPDSGVEDVTTPADNDYQMQSRNVQSLRQLASDAVKKSKKVEDLKNSDVLGGLRHTRNKLKLDLPPSPSAFTSSKMFNIEQNLDPVVNREKPSFTTFGKSRFLVQHVDTPPDEASKSKNVSFEALPYKPMETHILKEDFDNDKNKQKVEIVRGEASLLDSADEDSGIESSTLERKLSNTTVVE